MKNSLCLTSDAQRKEESLVSLEIICIFFLVSIFSLYLLPAKSSKEVPSGPSVNELFLHTHNDLDEV